MNSLRRILCLTACIFLLGSAAIAQTANPQVVHLLLQRAQAQARSGHMDIAIATWKQVLAADPNNVEALTGLATAAEQAGHRDEAQQYIERLHKAGADAATIARVESTTAQPTNEVMLQRAARLTEAGQYAEALAIYRRLYGDNPPNGDMALTYYDTMAALPANRPQAIAGLRRLAQQFPNDERYAITLGRVLTYDAPTRAEGIGILERYPNSPPAQTALQQAERWNQRGQQGGGAPVAAEAARTSEVGLGYKALNAGNLSSAESHFHSSLIRESAKGDAYAGLGYVAMRRQDFAAAVRSFEEARRNGNQDPKVRDALETAQFWTQMSQASQAAESGRLEDAIAAYRGALARRPENIDALNGLGGALLQAGRASEAATYLARAVRAKGNEQQRTNAWRALFLAQSQSGQRAEAIRTAESIPATQRTSLESDPEFLGTLAADYSSTGNRAEADRLLRRSLALFQSGGKELTSGQRLQYASLLSSAGRYPEAAQTYRRVLDDEPNNADAWRGLISAQHQAGRDAAALASLRQMPPEVTAKTGKDAGFLALEASIEQSQGQFAQARQTLESAWRIAPSSALREQMAGLEMGSGNTAAASRLYRQIVQAEPEDSTAWLGLVSALHSAGDDPGALREMAMMPQSMRDSLSRNPAFLQVLASIYGAVKDPRRAMLALNRMEAVYAERGEPMPPTALLQEGWLLLQSGENARLAQVVRTLATSNTLTADQRNQLAQLWANWAVHRSTALARMGNQAGAEMVLAAALRAFPQNVDVNNALAGAYLQNGDAKQAVLLYARQDMTKAPEPVCVAAINASLAANDRARSEEWLASALSRFGRDARVLEQAARFEEQRGDRRKAAAYYRAAMQAFKPPTVDDMLGESSAAPMSEAASEPAARQKLYQMLAPDSAEPLMARSAPSDTSDSDALWPVAAQARPTVTSSTPPTATLPGGGEDAFGSPIGSSTETLLPPPQTALAAPMPPSRQPSTPSQKAVLAPLDSPAYPADDASAHRGKAQEDLLPMPAAQPERASTAPERRSPALPEPEATQRHGQSAMTQSAPFVPQAREEAQSSGYEPQPSTSIPAALPEEAPRRPLQTLDSPELTAELAQEPQPQLAPLPALTDRRRTVQPPATPAQRVQQRLESIENGASSMFAGDSYIGYHSGQPGFDRLTTFGADIVQSAAIGMGARLSVITQPVLLESETAQKDATYQLGSLAAGSLPAAQNAAGVGGEVQLRTRSFGAAVGYTPYGFLVSNVTGRLLVQPDAGPVTFTFERQPITDSQLSYAGLRDPGSIGPNYPGNIWGGVISNAGSLQVSHGTADSGWYASMGGQYITGHHVRDNFRIDGDAGAYWLVWQNPEYGRLTLGMNLFGMHYDNNQRQFTYGNGGYFSPGSYLLSSIPLTLDGGHGPRLHYHLDTSVGLQAFQEASAPFFPLDDALQSSAQGGYLAERSEVGANYNIEGETSYLINEHWHVNGFFSLNNTRGYNNDRVGFSLRYAFRPQSLGFAQGPTGVGGLRGLIPLVLP